MENDYSEHTDLELTRAWNHLETCQLTVEIDKRMDSIMRECQARGILAWDEKGEITARINRG